MLKYDKAVKRYSENFKLKVLSEIDQGRLNKEEACRKYGVSSGALYSWIKKYSKFELYNQRIKIETMDEKDRLKALEEENRRLKQILADKDVSILVKDSMLEVLRKQMGFKSIDELKKKYGIDQ